MKRTHSVLVSAFLAAAMVLSMAGAAAAQEAGPSILRISKIEGGKVKTPEYQLLKGQMVATTRDWFAVNTSYETAPDWIDELTFTYYILVKGKPTGKYMLFRGEVTYVNVAKGKHKSDMYLHPSTLHRYGDVERIAVVVNSQGRIVGMESRPSSQQRWWEQLAPADGYVLNRMQTPFAMINFDDYEAIKPTGGR